MSGSYDLAQICLNGHVINSYARSSPGFNQKCCIKCGAATVTSCQHCKSDIRGKYNSQDAFSVIGIYHTPAFCHECGKPYPWTEMKIAAARELALELKELTPEDKETLTKSIDDIVTDSPRTTLGATRFKRMMDKIGKETASVFKDILVSIVSEAAKKTIWP